MEVESLNRELERTLVAIVQECEIEAGSKPSARRPRRRCDLVIGRSSRRGKDPVHSECDGLEQWFPPIVALAQEACLDSGRTAWLEAVGNRPSP